jgi:CheY-like chemotaxis protein
VTGKSILVLEENSVVHGLIASALDMDGLTLHHEFNPARYVERARALKPDLILVSNADQYNNYSICRELKTGPASGIPLVLLANSRDKLDQARLSELRVDGVVRKPFEAGDLQAQVSRHLHLPDLAGAAYEFRQSQSAREAMFDPLAQMEVLDEETVSMMKSTGIAGPPPVPEVDFSAELSVEKTISAPPARGGLERPEAGEAWQGSASAAVEPAPATPQPAGFDDSDLAPAESAEDELLLDASTFEQEDLAEPFPAMRAGEEVEFDELGAEDLLDDETAADLPLPVKEAPAGGVETEAPAALETSPLDQIDVELSASDLVIQQVAELEPTPDDMTLFEPEPESARPVKPLDETIPLAVRRMMELKPVFTPPAPQALAPEASPSREPPLIAEEPRRESPAPGPSWPEPAPEQAPSVAGPSAEEWRTLGLEDDELDEEQILSAMESEPLTEFGDVEGLEDDSLLDISPEEEEQLASLPEPGVSALEPLSAPEEDDEEITIDEDEEEMILSSLEEEELGAMAPEPPAPSALDLTGAERRGLEEILAAQEERPAEAPAASQEIEAMDLELSAQEATPRESGLPFPADELLEVPPVEEFRLEPEAPAGQAAGTAAASLTQGAAETAPPEPPEVAIEFGTDDLQADLFSETDLGTVGDDLAGTVMLEEEPPPGEEAGRAQIPQPGPITGVDAGLELTPAAAEEQRVEKTEEPPAPAEDADLEFESAFAALREEIETHPEGERLDDVLRLEGIQNQIARLDFTIPQHESPFARGIGLYALPEGGPVLDPLATTGQAAGTVTGTEAQPETLAPREVVPAGQTIESRLTQALEGAPLSGSLLDEATRARLGQVLDEIISISVRKAVREEMPRLMQRMAKESPQA